MEKTPRNFILLSILAFVIMSITGLSLIPMVNAAYSSESSLVGFHVFLDLVVAIVLPKLVWQQ